MSARHAGFVGPCMDTEGLRFKNREASMTKGRLPLAGMLVGCWVGMMAASDAALAVNAWERWDQPLSSTQPRTPLQAYHDVQVEATFWIKSGTTCSEPAEGTCTNPSTCFKGLAFWDGDAAHPGAFMVRSAFPANTTWCWKTCLLPKTRPNPSQPSICTTDTGLNQSGEVAVGAASGKPLSSTGFLKAPPSKRNLTFWNGQTPFLWIGDTAWNAPINHAANPTVWSNYVTSRAQSFVGNSFDGGNGFTNVLVAPAVQTLQNPPSVGFKGFVTASGCTGGSASVVPSSCHYWDSTYWRDFDKLIKDANDAGIVVVVADLMDPLNRGGSNQQLSPIVPFPASVDATAFARNLAARLAGSFVVFSPSFDARVADSAADGKSVPDLINAVGNAIHSAAPRHLIGLHLAGGSALSDYDQFQSTTKPWLSLQVFQSGHHAGTCLSGVTDDYANFACRARAFALRFRCIGEPTSNVTCTGSGAPAGLPTKPAVNVEGQYETPGDNETRVQTRHTGWNSGLSGSFGFNIGVYPDISRWTNPTAYSAANHRSDDDLGRMKGLFKSMPWTDLIPRHDLLVEQNNSSGTLCSGTTFAANGVFAKADWLQIWKPLLAMDSLTNYGLAYLPRPMQCTITSGGTTTTVKPSTNIVLDRTKASSLGVSCAAFTGQWVSPGDTSGANGFAAVSAVCTTSNSAIIFAEPQQNRLACGANCDRVLKLTRKVPIPGNAPNLATAPSIDLLTDVDFSDDGQTSVITGQIWSDGLPVGIPVPLGGPDLLFRKLPSATLDAAGNFFIAWEEENPSGTDDIVGGRFDSSLEMLEPPFFLNDTMDGQQSEPWVSSDASGMIVAVWTSYSEDEEIGGDIYGKVFDSVGDPLGPELLVSSDTLGNQFMPQVQMDGDGGFVIAWTAEPPSDLTVVPDDPTTLSASAGVRSPKAAARKKAGGVYYRVYGANGRPHGVEKHVESGNSGRDSLRKLEVHRHGGFKILWHEVDSNGVDQGDHEQEYGQDGAPQGGRR